MKKIVFFVSMIACLFCFPKSSFALSNNEIQIDSFKLLLRSDAQSETIPIKNADVRIFGHIKDENKSFLLGTAVSGENGEIKDLFFKGNREFDQVSFQYFFGKQDNRGFIIRLSGYKYNANHTREVPNSRKINTTRISSINGTNGTAEFYIELANLNNIYNDVYENQVAAKKAAEPYIPSHHINFEQIDMIYDLEVIQAGNSFNRNGKGSIEDPVLCINTQASSNWEWDRTCAVVHEWAHSNMYQINKFPNDAYTSHSSYNKKPETSYKEGWAVFQRHRFTCGLRNEFSNDVQVQNDNQLFGVSTNYTVKGALYDIYDINYDKYSELEDDQFDIYTLFVNGSHTIEEKDLISEGIMHTLMVDSGARTFKDFYQYLVTNYVDKHPDKTMKKKLVRAMAVNGIDADGDFMVKK